MRIRSASAAVIAFSALVFLPIELSAAPNTAQDKKNTGAMEPRVAVYRSDMAAQSSFNAFAQSFTKGVFVSIGDIDGDGVSEIVTGAGRGGDPEVRIYTTEGTLLNTFHAYNKNFHGGVRVVAFDLDADGKSEIITAPGPGGGPEVRIFSPDGNIQKRFFAFDIDFRGGVNISAGNLGPHGEPRIVTGSGLGGSHVRFFNANGKESGKGLRPFGESMNGVVVTAVPVNGSRAQLAVAEERLSPPVIKVYNLASPSAPKKAFKAHSSSYRGGLTLSSGDVNGDDVSEIVVGVGPGQRSKIKIFSLNGVEVSTIEPYASTFIGGTNVAAAQGLLVAGPSAVSIDGRTDLYKYIQIDLSSQTLHYYENGRLIGTGRVSTGKWSTPTPIGTFAIKNKIPVAYSKPYDLYMEWWMAFTPDGSYGLHAFPFWKTKDGGKRYEGASHLGTPVSHGCIRQKIDEAKKMYQWATIGTPVIVKR